MNRLDCRFLAFLTALFCCSIPITSQDIKDHRKTCEKEIERFAKTLEPQGNLLDFTTTTFRESGEKGPSSTLSVLIDSKSENKMRFLGRPFKGETSGVVALHETIVSGKRRIMAVQNPVSTGTLMALDENINHQWDAGVGEGFLFVGKMYYKNGDKSITDLLKEIRACKAVKMSKTRKNRRLRFIYQLEARNEVWFSFNNEDKRLVSIQYIQKFPPEVADKTGRTEIFRVFYEFEFDERNKRLRQYSVRETTFLKAGLTDYKYTCKLTKEKRDDIKINDRFQHLKIKEGTKVHVAGKPDLQFEYRQGKVVPVVDNQ